MVKTFIEKYTEVKGHREDERFILKNLTTTKDTKIRITHFGWSITHFHGAKWYVEFSKKLDEIFFDEEINGKGSIAFPSYIHIYKEDRKTPVKEVDLRDVLSAAYATHKLLKK